MICQFHHGVASQRRTRRAAGQPTHGGTRGRATSRRGRSEDRRDQTGRDQTGGGRKTGEIRPGGVGTRPPQPPPSLSYYGERKGEGGGSPRWWCLRSVRCGARGGAHPVGREHKMVVPTVGQVVPNGRSDGRACGGAHTVGRESKMLVPTRGVSCQG